jgi:tetratricopeptide (TPR) repeat protein
MIYTMKKNIVYRFCLFLISFALLSGAGCTGMATSAEEYYSIGMAYFELGKFEEAEKWLNRASMANKTKVASEYNLGRIAFETGRYGEAARHFDNILKRDPQNTLALKAAAYTRIKTGEIALAEKHYSALLALVPESADDGYNYALVLYALEKYADAERVLGANQFAIDDSNDMLLLYARSLQKQGKVEAIDSYAKWLANNTDAKVRCEYAALLESQELYARALEEYRTALSGLAQDSTDPSKNDLRFTIARLLLIADSESTEGITELQTAVNEGYGNIEAMEELLKDTRVSAANKDSLRTLINEAQKAAEEAEKKAVETAEQTTADAEKTTEEAASASASAGSETQAEAGSDSTNK